MKKFFVFVAVVIVVIVAIVCNNQGNGFSIAGIGEGKSLMELNKQDTTKVNVVSFAEENYTTTDGNLAQVTTIANYEHMKNGIYYGADGIFTVSSQFGICCPTNDVKIGLDFGTYKLEAKVGNFTRNTVKTASFDAQFQNDLILLGEPASVSNAVQISYLSKNTKVFAGYQGGSKFYSFEGGNWYASAEQNIKNVALSGGINFTQTTTGYAAAKWKTGNNTFTATANNIGSENKSFVLSYVRNSINVGKDVNMSLGTAWWSQSQKQGFRMVAGFNKGKANLFAEAGGSLISKVFTPMFGVGLGYKL
jgi:hypothetical protein